MTVLVTGHRGFVGRHLIEELTGRGVSWMGYDVKDGQDIETCLLPDADQIDRIYHLAAQTDAYCLDARHDARTNILATLRLLRIFGGSKVVFASTSMVNYPETPYAISKQAAEHYVRLDGGAIVRFCNLYGEGGHSVIDRFMAEDVCTIYGSGEQRRTYAHVSTAVNALLAARPGKISVVWGRERTVNEIANETGKPIVRAAARKFDLMDATQRRA
jgi:UDP-glucose 4-epimerase